MAELLKIEKTEDTPMVCLDRDKSIFVIKGASFPENAVSFYNQIIDWINIVIPSLNKELVCDFYLIYLNSASNKMLYDIFQELDNWYLKGKQISVTWNYDEMDEDMLELGEDFADLIEMPFEFQSVEVEEEEEDFFYLD